MTETQPNLDKLFCYIHPQRETLLRCNRCERPICVECAVLTPTGYRCKMCVKSQQKTFETAQTQDLVLAVIISVIISFAGSIIAGRLGFLTILIAPGAGIITAEVVRRAVHRRRSKLLFQLAAGAAVLGSLPLVLLSILTGNIFSIIWQGLYAFLIVSSLYYRLSGIQISR